MNFRDQKKYLTKELRSLKIKTNPNYFVRQDIVMIQNTINYLNRQMKGSK